MTKPNPFTDNLFLSLPLGASRTPVHAGATRLQGLELGSEQGGWHIPVPGWVWNDTKAGGPLRLTVGRGLLRKTMTLTRVALAERFIRLANTPHSEVPIYDLINALEHAAHAHGVIEGLPAKVQSYLQEAAAETGLAGALPALSPALRVLSTSADTEITLGKLVAAFGAVQRHDKNGDDLEDLKKTLSQVSLSPELRRGLALELTPHFCTFGDPQALYDFLLDGDLTQIEPMAGHAWQGSHCLPARILAGDLDGAAGIFEELNASPGRWSSTPSIGWSLRYLAAPPEPRFDPILQIEVLTLGLRFVDAQNELYFGASRCVQLQRAVIFLIANQHLFPGPFQSDLTWTALRCYGASPTFWRTLRKKASSLPPELQAAGQCFDTLREAAEAPQSDLLADVSLKGLMRFGVADADRMRRDLFGPFGAPGGPDVTLMQVARDTAHPSDAFVRGLAAPLAPAVQGLGEDTLRTALARAYEHTPPAPSAELAGRAGRAARNLIAAATQENAATLTKAVSALIDLLPALCRADAGYRGIGLGLSVLVDLSDRNATAAQGYGQSLQTILQHSIRFQGTACLDGPWPAAAMTRLAERHPKLSEDLCSTVPELADIPLHDNNLPNGVGAFAQTRALDDTLVIVQSTRKGLAENLPALRQGWLTQLERLGVPWLISIGQPPDQAAKPLRLQGNVLELPIRDDPLHATDRLIALIDWAYRETDFAHLTILDDDTRIVTGLWFAEQNYRLVDFYGQVTTRWEKNDLRRMHQSLSPDAQVSHSFEKLPRNLVYADGQFGLSLSRKSMKAVSEVMSTPQGKLLRLSGFAADKMLSAVLQQAGIWPQGQGLYAAGFSQASPDAPALPDRLNGFDMSDNVDVARSAGSITQVVHGKAPPMSAEAQLWPRKIWANHAPARLGLFSNALHLVSAEETLRRSTGISVVTVLRNERFMLPHFLKHYRALGVDRFLIADNGSDDGSLEYLADQSDVVLFAAESEFRHANQGTDWKIGLMQQYARDHWTLVADTDEFLVYPDHQTQTLSEYLSRYEGSTIDAVRILMLDMYPRGPLADATFKGGGPFDEAGFADRHAFLENSLARGPYSAEATRTSGLRHRILPGSRAELFVTQKTALFRYKPWMRFSVSLHYAADVHLATDDLMFAHFKYHANFREKAKREVTRGQYFNNAEEYRKYLALAAEGRDRLYDPARSVPWRDVEAVRRILRLKS